MFSVVGKTSSDMLVVGGVYAFFETHGVPLGDIINALVCRHGMLPSWPYLVADMTKAGRPFDRAIEAALSAARDACCFNNAVAAICER